MRHLFWILVSLCFSSNLYAHQSGEPIDIHCSIVNHVNPDLKYKHAQILQPVVSPKILKEHFDLKSGLPNAFTGYLNTRIPLVANIKTKTGTIKRTGYLFVMYDEASDNVITELNDRPMPAGITIHWKIADEAEFNDAKNDTVESCQLLP